MGVINFFFKKKKNLVQSRSLDLVNSNSENAISRVIHYKTPSKLSRARIITVWHQQPTVAILEAV